MARTGGRLCEVLEMARRVPSTTRRFLKSRKTMNEGPTRDAPYLARSVAAGSTCNISRGERRR